MDWDWQCSCGRFGCPGSHGCDCGSQRCSGVLRILPGNPELYVQTFDDNGKTLQLEQVKRLYVESTSLEGRLSKGEIAYYAIVYEAPVLGALQRLRVSVSQTEAADEPATAAVGTMRCASKFETLMLRQNFDSCKGI